MNIKEDNINGYEVETSHKIFATAILLKVSIAVHSIRSSWTETNKIKKQSKIFHRQVFFLALSFTLWYK
jgi:hypothetical protein